ncbi:MAG TPA: haloacid dehalogenase-like hydrolase [Longimicrobiaceae bacterium]|nr:haloacid dehalogenase-like hydrolase [Longimicrobiaceae bacterium]
MRRLVLFDIDGTLLSADGAGKRAVRAALLEVFGTAGSIHGYSFAGRTDPEIVRDLLRGDGLSDAEIDRGLPALWFRYVENLHAEVGHMRVRPLPGVLPLVERIEHAGGETVLGLLTGNIAAGARIKLDAAGLRFDRFRVGAFGSDHAARPELPAIAVERARAVTGVEFSGKEIVIVGDTPKDVACGLHLGVRTIATATGQHSADELAACGADYVFADLSDADAVWCAIEA